MFSSQLAQIPNEPAWMRRRAGRSSRKRLVLRSPDRSRCNRDRWRAGFDPSHRDCRRSPALRGWPWRFLSQPAAPLKPCEMHLAPDLSHFPTQSFPTCCRLFTTLWSIGRAEGHGNENPADGPPNVQSRQEPCSSDAQDGNDISSCDHRRSMGKSSKGAELKTGSGMRDSNEGCATGDQA